MTLCYRRLYEEDCGDPFAGDDLCVRCIRDSRYPALAAERFRKGALHPVCVIWWRRQEPGEMCGDCLDLLPSALTERGRLLWCALSRGLPPDPLRRAVNLVQDRMRERAVDRGECCYLCGVRVRRFRICRPEIEHVDVQALRDDPLNWRIADSICNNLKGSTSGREYYWMVVSYRIGRAEQVAALLLGRVGRCASASVLYGGSLSVHAAWGRLMAREDRGVVGHSKLMTGDGPGTFLRIEESVEVQANL